MDSLAIKIQELLIFLPFFMIAVTFHEVAHGYSAYLLGDPTAKYAGRLTLNPMAHIDPTGSVMFLISFMIGFGFGWAKPVPVNPTLLKNPRRDDIIVSLAGVAVNFLLMVASIIVIKVFIYLLSNEILILNRIAVQWIFRLTFQFMVLNLILFIFNLIPVPPLDGSHVLMALLPLNQARAFANLRQYGFIILLLLMSTGILNTVFSVAYHTVVRIAGLGMFL